MLIQWQGNISLIKKMLLIISLSSDAFLQHANRDDLFAMTPLLLTGPPLMLLMFYSESENLILKGVSVYDSSHNNNDIQ